MKNKDVLLAIVLGLLAFFVVDLFFPKTPGRSVLPTTESAVVETETVKSVPIEEGPFVRVHNALVDGRISLRGGAITDWHLSAYKDTLASDSPTVQVLSAQQTAQSGFSSTTTEVPQPDTLWQADQQELTPNKPLTLRWRNTQGVEFVRVFVLDDNYMLTITDRAVNRSQQKAVVRWRGQITAINPSMEKSVVHQGFVGVMDDILQEETFDAVKKDGQKHFTTQEGWVGITSKYWLTSLAFAGQGVKQTDYRYQQQQNNAIFTAQALSEERILAPGQSTEQVAYIFVGPKEYKLLAAYQQALNIPKFDLAIDFGWYFFLTKPFLLLLGWFAHWIGNMGVAILLLATLVRLLMLPVASKSFESMAKMKKLQPEMTRLQEMYKNDKMRLNQEMLLLYKKHHVSPASGCLPVLIQIPVFFSLYKVLSVAIEMRQAPFVWWIHDLSAPDPSSVFTLFGYVPWPSPSFLNLGVLPVLMGITMYLQQKMTPTTNPDQKTNPALQWMPILFTFMFGRMASGLVLYWTWSNILSMIQQKYIMRKTGS